MHKFLQVLIGNKASNKSKFRLFNWTVALQLSSIQVSFRNMKSRLYVIIKSLTRSDLFLSEPMFKTANLTVLLFVLTAIFGMK